MKTKHINDLTLKNSVNGEEMIPVQDIDGVTKAIKAKEFVTKTFIYVEEFGAKGDGTDDTVHIQSAIDYASENSLEVRFKNKLYRTCSPLVLKQGVKLIGSNSSHFSSNTIIRNGQTTMFADFPTSLSSKLMNITIKDICFDGNNTMFMNNESGNIGYLNWSRISNCHFRKFSNILGNIALTGCDISYLNINANEMGVLRGSDNTFYNIFFDSTEYTTKKDYILIVDGTVNNITNIFFTSNTNPQTLSSNGCSGILKVPGSNNIISNCWFDYCERYAVELNSSSKSNLFIGNLFRGCGSYNNAFIENKGTNNTFIGNRFSKPHIDGYQYGKNTFINTSDNYTDLGTMVEGDIANTGNKSHMLKKLLTTFLEYDGRANKLTFDSNGVAVLEFDITNDALYKTLSIHVDDSNITFLKSESDHVTGKLTIVLRSNAGYTVNKKVKLTVEAFRII